MNARRLLEFLKLHAGKNSIALNAERKTVDQIVAKLLENDEKYGQRFCPCRPPAGDTDKDRLIICPCVYHLDEVRLLGKCLCGLFVESKL